MRKEKELNVSDVHTRALRAADRVGSNGKLHETMLPPVSQSWWRKYFKWEHNLTVGNKTVAKGFVITPGIAAVLLAAFLGVLGWAYKSNTADQRETRDSIIRMETMLDERTRTFKEQQAKIESKLETEKNVAQLQREQANKTLTAMRFALQEKGIRVTE